MHAEMLSEKLPPFCLDVSVKRRVIVRKSYKLNWKHIIKVSVPMGNKAKLRLWKYESLQENINLFELDGFTTKHKLTQIYQIMFVLYLGLLKAYRQTSNTRRTLRGNWIVDHSDVDAASPVGAAPTTSSLST